jgi:hypothetical protein
VEMIRVPALPLAFGVCPQREEGRPRSCHHDLPVTRRGGRLAGRPYCDYY